MPVQFSISSLLTVLFRPNKVFEALAVAEPSAPKVFFGFALWLGLLPPLFAYIGTMRFGWRLGVEPVFLPRPTVLAICAAYFVALLFGFLSGAVVARWMAVTYGDQALAMFKQHYPKIGLALAGIIVLIVIINTIRHKKRCRKICIIFDEKRYLPTDH